MRVAAQGEHPEIAAAVATLARRDEQLAGNAGAALQWITGEHGLALLTQERIQNFCWYELPLKWTISLDAKVQIAVALAQALDLLGLPRYAAICRSPVTGEILAIYEASPSRGKAAFRRAAAASGVVPPGVPGFEWGQAMGFLEAAAWSSASGLLELAVAAGDVVPGARGWKSRQRQLVHSYLDRPQAELAGETFGQAILTERVEIWVNFRRSPSRRRVMAGVAGRLLSQAGSPAGDLRDPLPRLTWLLEEFRSGVGLTRAGNMNRMFVQRNAGLFGWDRARPPRSEHDLADLRRLRCFVERLGFTCSCTQVLKLNAAGRRVLAQPEKLWRLATAGLLKDSDFAVFAGELFLALLLAGPVPFEEIKGLVKKAAGEEGFRENRTGKPPTGHDIAWAIHRTGDLCRALGLLAECGGDPDGHPYSLTSDGAVTAQEALRARATSPVALPLA
jgi:hypothetical protein